MVSWDCLLNDISQNNEILSSINFKYILIVTLWVVDLEKEDLLLDLVLHSRSVAMGKLRAGRQPLILVASLLDRIPNLAGLARTCEVCYEGKNDFCLVCKGAIVL